MKKALAISAMMLALASCCTTTKTSCATECAKACCEKKACKADCQKVCCVKEGASVDQKSDYLLVYSPRTKMFFRQSN